MTANQFLINTDLRFLKLFVSQSYKMTNRWQMWCVLLIQHLQISLKSQ